MKITRGAAALVLFASLSTINACAQSTTRVDVRNTLWRVESGEKILYLLGSVHALTKDAYPLHPAIEGAFDRSNVLVLEIAMDSASTNAVQMQMLSRGMMGGGKTLKKILPDSTYTRAAERLKEMGVGMAMVEGLKPWVVAVLLTAADMQKKGYEAGLGIDYYFQTKADKSSRPVKGLETAEFQLGLFDGLSLEEQISFLDQTLSDSKDDPDMIGRIVDAWKRGDAEALEKFLVAETFSENPKLLAALVTDRNRRWIPAIEGFLNDSKTHMVVVGALHLVGPEGVVALLREKGYKVEQL